MKTVNLYLSYNPGPQTKGVRTYDSEPTKIVNADFTMSSRRSKRSKAKADVLDLFDQNRLVFKHSEVASVKVWCFISVKNRVTK